MRAYAVYGVVFWYIYTPRSDEIEAHSLVRAQKCMYLNVYVH